MARHRNLEARSHILCTAYGLFYDKGFRGTSMEDVALAAKIKKANLFHYFPTKEDLGLAVFDYAAACFKEKITAQYVPEKTADPVRFVEQIFDGFAENMKKNSCCRGCFMGNLAQEMSDHNEKLRSKISEYFEFWSRQLTEVFSSAKSNGFFKKSFSPGEASGAVIALIEGALLFSKTTKDVKQIRNASKMASGYLEFYRAR